MNVTNKLDWRDRLIERIERYNENGWNPVKNMIYLAHYDNVKFLEMYEKMLPKYKWSKNTKIAKTYELVKAGKIEEIIDGIFFRDDYLIAYFEENFVYIKFHTVPDRPLQVVMRSRGWWWSKPDRAWRTYLKRLDKEWIYTISKIYRRYL